jgi:hypothetical protein
MNKTDRCANRRCNKAKIKGEAPFVLHLMSDRIVLLCEACAVEFATILLPVQEKMLDEYLGRSADQEKIGRDCDVASVVEQYLKIVIDNHFTETK